jgi:hypothetical protein
LQPANRAEGMTLSSSHTGYFSKSKAELIDEIVQLNKELKAKNEDCNAEKEAFALQVYTMWR